MSIIYFWVYIIFMNTTYNAKENECMSKLQHMVLFKKLQDLFKIEVPLAGGLIKVKLTRKEYKRYKEIYSTDNNFDIVKLDLFKRNKPKYTILKNQNEIDEYLKDSSFMNDIKK